LEANTLFQVLLLGVVQVILAASCICLFLVGSIMLSPFFTSAFFVGMIRREIPGKNFVAVSLPVCSFEGFLLFWMFFAPSSHFFARCFGICVVSSPQSVVALGAELRVSSLALHHGVIRRLGPAALGAEFTRLFGGWEWPTA